MISENADRGAVNDNGECTRGAWIALEADRNLDSFGVTPNGSTLGVDDWKKMIDASVDVVLLMISAEGDYV